MITITNPIIAGSPVSISSEPMMPVIQRYSFTGLYNQIAGKDSAAETCKISISPEITLYNPRKTTPDHIDPVSKTINAKAHPIRKIAINKDITL